MEPQLEGCGKRLALLVAAVGAGASMEPQLEGCGKRAARIARWGRMTKLQWSRNLRVAESARRLHGRHEMVPASMEPQLEGCGKRMSFRDNPAAAQASMEPQLEGCGKSMALRGYSIQQTGFNGAAT